MITISIDNNSQQPIYLQIYEYIKREILGGQLQSPAKLPSTRSLAAHLEVSRTTVETAYEQLVAEGYVEAKEKRGYFVIPITHLQQFHSNITSTVTVPAPPLPEQARLFDFNPDTIDAEHFPYSIWKSLGKNQIDSADNFVAGEHFGDYRLRQAIAGYLRGSRGVQCSPEHIVVGAGLDHLLQMLCLVFERRTAVAMEDPAYQNARQVLLANAYDVIDIPLRNCSFDTQALARSDADICYVTPSHQFPLGFVMPVSRRQELLRWAGEKAERYIIEDDHDSEFRYKGRPIPSLHSLDTKNKVIYIGTFSKAVSPAIRTAYMVLPETLFPQYKNLCGSFSCPVPRFMQSLLADFINEGYFEKHLNRMRKIYKGKHDFMLQKIKQYFPEERVEISGDHAGLYIIFHYKGELSEQEIEMRAKKAGISLHPLRNYYANLPVGYKPAYLLGFANLNTDMIAQGIRRLSEQVFV